MSEGEGFDEVGRLDERVSRERRGGRGRFVSSGAEKADDWNLRARSGVERSYRDRNLAENDPVIHDGMPLHEGGALNEVAKLEEQVEAEGCKKREALSEREAESCSRDVSFWEAWGVHDVCAGVV